MIIVPTDYEGWIGTRRKNKDGRNNKFKEMMYDKYDIKGNAIKKLSLYF
ncbi:3457_t:CDS:2 [Racocetra fulgida]|uniref:3457_t:CDS:1 n=1 Tax=Racocetra fulgida TaxID=60492 RepID=A0A9N9ABS6_9GLOM|nr:3457_t:CDS:2 [Racocetra fulgida]